MTAGRGAAIGSPTRGGRRQGPGHSVNTIDAFGRRHCQRGQHGGRRCRDRADQDIASIFLVHGQNDVGLPRCQYQASFVCWVCRR
jgi:hypothetical protein